MADKEPIRVVLVDHHLLVRGGLRALLSTVPDIELVAEAANGQEALCICDQTHPDVVVMELAMPVMDGVTATRLIRQRCPDTQVIVLTCSANDDAVEQVLLAGAVGYLITNITPEAFVNSIREASQGISTLAPEVTRALIRMRNAPLPVGHDLTEREQEVLLLMADGLSNHEIAVRYKISYSTVQFHVSNILSKLGVGNRVEAVAFAIRQNLV